MCLMSMKFFKVVIIFFRVIFPIFIIGNFDLHTLILHTEAVIRRCLVKGVLRNFTKSTGKHLCQSLF